MFADTDFILGLLKDSDWLKENAVKILDGYKGKIKTSISVMIEVALICKRLNMDVLNTFAHIFEIIIVDEKTQEVCLRAALYITKYGLGVFDSFNAAFSINDKIISSDSVYDTLGLARLNLR